MTTGYDALVIGGGQSGLAATHHLRKHGLTVALLEAGPEPVGSWPHYYDSLTLFSPARYSALPGLLFPGDPDHYPHRDDVIDDLRQYAKTLDADIHTHQRVDTVTHNGHLFTAHTDTGASFTAPSCCVARAPRPRSTSPPGRTRRSAHSFSLRDEIVCRVPARKSVVSRVLRPIRGWFV
ncbi:NAD(P)-binding domain-containing protein [Nocardia lijiangensis]|uniref:NAD(P)-binding domain-containing protein n=1 Tax=Nocardia lijiangensis TaxID=299618 RepID=UPI000A02DC75|nr:NAD(P)-binding domain-containing protein [Nocardia lijiangensis]